MTKKEYLEALKKSKGAFRKITKKELVRLEILRNKDLERIKFNKSVKWQ